MIAAKKKKNTEPPIPYSENGRLENDIDFSKLNIEAFDINNIVKDVALESLEADASAAPIKRNKKTGEKKKDSPQRRQSKQQTLPENQEDNDNQSFDVLRDNDPKLDITDKDLLDLQAAFARLDQGSSSASRDNGEFEELGFSDSLGLDFDSDPTLEDLENEGSKSAGTDKSKLTDEGSKRYPQGTFSSKEKTAAAASASAATRAASAKRRKELMAAGLNKTAAAASVKLENANPNYSAIVNDDEKLVIDGIEVDKKVQNLKC
ncbi:unnamed protein product [Sphagnum balticum]